MSATTPTGRPATAALTPRQITRRRRAEAARRSWREFRTHRSGLLGLGILTFFVLVAVLAWPSAETPAPSARSSSWNSKPGLCCRCFSRSRLSWTL